MKENRLKDSSNTIHEKGLSNETIQTRLGSLKTFLNWCFAKNYLKTKEFENYKKPTIESDREFIVLNETELDQLKKVKLKDNQAKIRDLFLFSIYTTQRFEDCIYFDYSSIDNNRVWTLVQRKTGKKIKIPLVKSLAYAYTIAQKYKEGFPRLSNAYVNRELKTICLKAEIKGKFTYTRKQLNSTKTIELDNKTDKISFHTARRTGITRLLNKGIPQTIVKKISGHNTLKEFEKYVQHNTKDVAKLL